MIGKEDKVIYRQYRPSKKSIKVYAENGYYHLYNRGVEKRVIFQDEQDYSVFLSYLKTYLLPKNESELRQKLANPTLSCKEKEHLLQLLRLNNFADEITLITYCLMPNHFHFLVKQNSAVGIDLFMNSLCTRYAMYFNRKYKRVGSLYQDVYKAVMVVSDEQLLHLTRYIHRNPVRSASKGDAFRTEIMGLPSSYPEYLGQRQTKWVHPEETLEFFSKTYPILSYQAFVEQEEDLRLIEAVVIDL